MSLLVKILIVVAVFCFMEFMAWFTHKYIMHGFMWVWHEDHHRHHKGFFEKNDLFAVVFAVFSISFFAIGNFIEGWEVMTYIGLGVLCYGFAYFTFHDVIVHRRIKIKFVAKSRYMKRIMRAHYIHHKVHSKEGAEAFSFLWAPKKYETKDL
ncbi:MAG: sterol desaturase family protein [Spirosomataceae bacterium]